MKDKSCGKTYEEKKKNEDEISVYGGLAKVNKDVD